MTDELDSTTKQPIDSKSIQRVIVIGGGLAGIAAALSLSDSGYQVTLLESRSKLGGRVGSFDDMRTEQAIDYCQHVGMACCTNLVKLLELLGIDKAWERQETLHFVSRDGIHFPVRASALPAPLHLGGLLMNWPDLRWIDRVRIAWGLFRLMRWKPTRKDDNTLAIEWLRSIGQTPSTIKTFWATILVSALGEQVDRVTLGAIRKVLIDGFAANRTAYHLLVPQQALSTLIGTNAESRLTTRGISVRLNSPVKKLRWIDNHCGGVEFADLATLDADQIVVAVPWHQIHRLIAPESNEVPAAVQEHFQNKPVLESAPITGVHTWWDRPWLDSPHAILIDRLCQWIFKCPGHQVNQIDEFYYQVVISGSRNLLRGEQQASLDAIVADLRDVFPKAKTSKFLRGKIVTDPNSVFSVAKGHQQARPRCDLFAEHRLWLCGDWTDTGWPATMEGAIRSGFSVTELMMGQNGKKRRWIADDLPQNWLARLLIRN